MATVVHVRDRVAGTTVALMELPEGLPEQEAAAVAGFKLSFGDDQRFEVRALHGPSVAEIKRLHEL